LHSSCDWSAARECLGDQTQLRGDAVLADNEQASFLPVPISVVMPAIGPARRARFPRDADGSSRSAGCSWANESDAAAELVLDLAHPRPRFRPLAPGVGHRIGLDAGDRLRAWREDYADHGPPPFTEILRAGG
jgi:hypothetical protein